MRKAIELSKENVANGGGPFGAVIATKEGEIIATGVNRVTSSCDPTAHAEVSAIRAAAAKLGTFNLSGYEIYTSCEPCPMCLGAIYWARLDKMYYGNNKTDAKNIGFDDSFIYDELALKPADRKLPSEVLLHNEAITAFEAWMSKEDKVELFQIAETFKAKVIDYGKDSLLLEFVQTATKNDAVVKLIKEEFHRIEVVRGGSVGIESISMMER